MKKNYTILFFALLLSTTALWAQPPGDKMEQKEQIEAMKVSFITTELNLTPEEAQAFWPIFNQFEAEKDAIMRKYNPRAGHSKKSLVDISKTEANELINNEIAYQQEKLDVTKKYIAKFRTVLSDEKVAALLALENKFKRMLINKMKRG